MPESVDAAARIVSSAAPRSVRLSLALTLVRPIVCDELCCVCARLTIASTSLQPLVSHMTGETAASRNAAAATAVSCLSVTDRLLFCLSLRQVWFCERLHRVLQPASQAHFTRIQRHSRRARQGQKMMSAVSRTQFVALSSMLAQKIHLKLEFLIYSSI